MKRCRWMTTASLTASLAVGSCLAAGDFCEVVRGPIEFEAETAQMVVRTDRPAAEVLDAQNSYGREFCPDWRS